jgi:hypothetical protein
LAVGRDKLSASELTDSEKALKAYTSKVGTLELTLDQVGATIQVDDEQVGTSPLKEPLPLSGTRTLSIKKAGFLPITQKVDIGGGQNTKLALHLEPMVLTTDVEIAVSGAPNASILIDGLARGSAPYRGKVSVQAEPHSFEAQAPGYDSVAQTAIAVEGQKLILSLSLAKKQDTGILLIEPQMPGTTILLDDKVVGANRWEGPVTLGMHRVTIKKEGYYTRTIDSVEVPPGARRSVAPTLDENKSSSWLFWAIGTTAIVTGASVAGYFLFRGSPGERVPGTLRIAEQTPVDTSVFRFR